MYNLLACNSVMCRCTVSEEGDAAATDGRAVEEPSANVY